MAELKRIPVVPDVLIWARKGISLSEEEAARRLQVSQDTLLKWESGELEPTISQLRKAAKLYRRPLAVLLLTEPPVDFDVLKDFRRGDVANPDWSHQLHAEFRRALSQREVFLELSELAPDTVPKVEWHLNLELGGDAEA